MGVLGALLERASIRRVYGRDQLAQIPLTFGLLLIVYDAKQFVRATATTFYPALHELFVDVREAMGSIWSRRAETYRGFDSRVDPS